MAAGPAKVVNFFQNVPSNPGGPATGSTSGVQCGYGVTGSFVPQSSGAALITISGTLASSAVSSSGMAGISIGIGAAPGLATSPVSGAAVGNQTIITNNASISGQAFPFTMQTIVTGLTLGVGYWIDMLLQAGPGLGTITPGNITIMALEL